MAIAGKLDNADYRIYTLLGDGSSEGTGMRALDAGSCKELDNLVVIVDNNNLRN